MTKIQKGCMDMHFSIKTIPKFYYYQIQFFGPEVKNNTIFLLVTTYNYHVFCNSTNEKYFMIIPIRNLIQK